PKTSPVMHSLCTRTSAVPLTSPITMATCSRPEGDSWNSFMVNVPCEVGTRASATMVTWDASTASGETGARDGSCGEFIGFSGIGALRASGHFRSLVKPLFADTVPGPQNPAIQVAIGPRNAHEGRRAGATAPNMWFSTIPGMAGPVKNP